MDLTLPIHFAGRFAVEILKNNLLKSLINDNIRLNLINSFPTEMY